jgi:glycosyltransferase involved in cell wall biosynthesis
VARRRRLVHVTTLDLSLAILLGPQLRAFADAGYEVIGVAGDAGNGEEVERWGARFVPAEHLTRAMAPHHDVAALLELRRLFAELQPDIVHTHNPKPGVYGRLAARAARVPVIVNTVHGLFALPDDPWPKRALVYGLERLAAAASHAELVQNVEDVEVLARLRVPRRRITLLGNGIDLERFDPRAISDAERRAVRAELGAGDDDIVVGAVGRLVVEKGYPELFAAAASLRAGHPEIRVVVAGPSDPSKSDAVSAQQLAQAERDGVRFLGMRGDVERLYAAMDVYVLASHREGFPRSAMEAAAMGLPVVATDIRGCRQVVDDGRTGVLFARGDADALRSALLALAADPARRRVLGAAGRRKALEEFDQQRVIDTTLVTYDRLLAG